jgi:hypothetical protein
MRTDIGDISFWLEKKTILVAATHQDRQATMAVSLATGQLPVSIVAGAFTLHQAGLPPMNSIMCRFAFYRPKTLPEGGEARQRLLEGYLPYLPVQQALLIEHAPPFHAGDPRQPPEKTFARWKAWVKTYWDVDIEMPPQEKEVLT